MAKSFTHNTAATGTTATLVVSGNAAEKAIAMNEIADGILHTMLPVGTRTASDTWTFGRDNRIQGHVQAWLKSGGARSYSTN